MGNDLDRIRHCARCTNLAANRTNVVMAEGLYPTDILFLTNAPKDREDAHRKPLAGVSGKFFRATVDALKLTRFRLSYLCSVMCRPPKREVTNEEIDNCRPHIATQIQLYKPKVIVALGRAAHCCATGAPLENIHIVNNCGNLIHSTFDHSLEKSLPIILTFDPAYVLQNRLQLESVFIRHLNAAARLVFSASK
jgi:uracil-DNA glycosylase family 4